MSPKETRNPETIHPPLGAYAHQVELTGAQRLLAIAGQVGMQPDGTIPDDVAAQFDVALENVVRNLAAAGMTVEDLVKLTYFFVEEVPPDERRAIVDRRFGQHRPATTLTYVPRLAAPAIKVEVEAWAAAEAR